MLCLQAPAKLNLYLRILGRRSDGYHEIETLFERIDLADELQFEKSSDLILTCDMSYSTIQRGRVSRRRSRAVGGSTPGGGAHERDVAVTGPAQTELEIITRLSCGEDNLIMKAARLLQRVSGTKHGARIHLTKRIPIAAGLGGGSSDAATTLLGLNELWSLQLDQPRLIELAAQLGSDVPFFLSQAPFAIGRGRGEQCEPLEVQAHLVHVLVIPNAQLSTKEVYGSGGFDLTASKPSLTMMIHALRNGPALAGLAEGLWNDLEPEAIRRCPIITVIQSQLHQFGCLGVRLSGSGPSVFGLCRDRAHAQDIVRRLRLQAPPAWRTELVETHQSGRERKKVLCSDGGE